MIFSVHTDYMRFYIYNIYNILYKALLQLRFYTSYYKVFRQPVTFAS